MEHAENEQPSSNVASVKSGEAMKQTWFSRDLLGAFHEARIVHGKEVYRLQLTSNQKLILIK